MNSTPDLSIIIVNWNTADALIACLRSVIMDGNALALELIVVDNASTDGSVELVRRTFPQVMVIANTRNAGFAAANNQALAIARGRYLFLLNPDTVVCPGALAALLAFMDTHPAAGIAGPRLVYPDGALQPSGHPDPSLSSELADILAWYRISGRPRFWHSGRDYSRVQEVDNVSGAALFTNRSVLEQIGALDAAFFMYYEDVDWCLRARRQGWKVYYVPQAEIVHHLALSSGEHAQPSLVEAYFHSREHYFRKYHGVLAPFILRATLLLTSVAKLVAYTLLWIIHRNAQTRAALAAHGTIVALCLGRRNSKVRPLEAEHA